MIGMQGHRHTPAIYCAHRAFKHTLRYLFFPEDFNGISLFVIFATMVNREEHRTEAHHCYGEKSY